MGIRRQDIRRVRSENVASLASSVPEREETRKDGETRARRIGGRHSMERHLFTTVPRSRREGTAARFVRGGWLLVLGCAPVIAIDTESSSTRCSSLIVLSSFSSSSLSSKLNDAKAASFVVAEKTSRGDSAWRTSSMKNSLPACARIRGMRGCSR